MIVARYLASLGIQIEKKDAAAVDKFLNKFEKDLKTSAKSTDALEKAVKKETKTTVDGLVQKEQKQKALNKQITVAAKNQKAWNKEFAYSIKMMTSKPMSSSALKSQQGMYNQLFGAIVPRTIIGATGANQKAWNSKFKQQIAGMTTTSGVSRRAMQDQLNAAFGAVTPKAMIGATGSNQRAWNTRFRQQIAGMSATSGISRRARQEQLEAAFGTGTRNPRLANMLNQRMSHLGGGKSDTLADMAAHYRNEQQVATLKEKTRRAEEESANRILSLHRREEQRKINNASRLAAYEGRLAEKEAVKLERVRAKTQRELQRQNRSATARFDSDARHISKLGLAGYGGAGGMALPPMMAMLSGPAMGVAVAAGGLAVGQQAAVALGNEQATREAQRTQLDIASGVTDRKSRNIANSRFFALSNKLGVEAEPMIDPYSKFMKQMLTQGRSADEAFSIYKDMSIATRSAGLGQVSMERQAYALQQIFGLGYAQGDELNKQLVDANPAMLGYIRDQYVKQTGKSPDTFKKAVSNREISSQLVIDAYKQASASGAGRVQEFASTVKADQARLANTMLEEQMGRTITDEVIPSMRKYVQAQKEMYEALGPFRDAIYKASASVLSFSADLLNKSAPYMKETGSIISNPLSPVNLGSDNILAGLPLKFAILGKVAYDRYTAEPPPQTQSGIDFLKRSKEGFQSSGQTQVMVQPGAFVIHTQASDPEEVGRFTAKWFKTQLELTMQANPQKE